MEGVRVHALGRWYFFILGAKCGVWENTGGVYVILPFYILERTLCAAVIVDLFLLFAASKMFLYIYKKTQDIFINFEELQQALQKDSKPPVYLSSLIDVAVKVEAIFDDCESCYVSCVLDDVKSISLGVIKDGLKKAITTETERIVKSCI